MNQIEAIVEEVQSEDTLTLVSFNFQGISLTMMSLELDKNIQKNTKVILTTKANQITLAKNDNLEISSSNILKARVEKVEEGKLLSSIELSVNNTFFEAIITKKAQKKMQIKEGDKLNMIIKANELSIREII